MRFKIFISLCDNLGIEILFQLLQHSCTKVRFNGRNGIVVAGGSSDANPSLSSLEFFDLNTKKWYSLGRMRQGRRYPAITLMNGKLLVTGNFKEHLTKIKNSSFIL